MNLLHLFVGLSGVASAIAAVLGIERQRIKANLKNWQEAHAELTLRHGSLASAFIKLQTEARQLRQDVEFWKRAAQTALKDTPNVTAASDTMSAPQAGESVGIAAPATAEQVAQQTPGDAFTIQPLSDKPTGETKGPISDTP